MQDDDLTPREEAIAIRAAELAVKQLTDEFYRNVGKNVVNKLLIFIGGLVVAFAVGKGWISSK